MKHKPVSNNQNKIVEWCKQDGIPYIAIESEKLPEKFFWQINISTPAIAIYQQKHLPDRIYFQQDINITDEHEKLVNKTWNPIKKQSMMSVIQTNVNSFDVFVDFITAKKLEKIRLYDIHFSKGLDKAIFLKKTLRLQSIIQQTMNLLSINMEVDLKQIEKAQEKSSEENPLAG